MKKDELLDRLAADLTPTRRFSPATLVVIWLTVSWAFVVAVTFATGDLRPSALAQLLSSPRFLLECLLGLIVGVLAFRAGVLLALPGRARWRRVVPETVVLIAVWFGAYVYGLIDPALEPSMVGKRPHCLAETFLFSSLPIALGLWLVARRTPIQRGWTGAMVGASAASLPALMMQIACMYDPKHILAFHLLPVLVMGLFGAFLGWVALRKP